MRLSWPYYGPCLQRVNVLTEKNPNCSKLKVLSLLVIFNSVARGSLTFQHLAFCRRPTFDTSVFWYLDILMERHFDTLTFCRRDILPPGHCVAETFCHPDIITPRHFDTLEKRYILLPKTFSHPELLPPNIHTKISSCKKREKNTKWNVYHNSSVGQLGAV